MVFAVLLALAAQTTSNKLPPAQALPPPATEEQAVLAPINALFAAFEAGDPTGVFRVVYPDGRVTAVGALRSGTGVRQESWTQFAARLKPGEGFQERISDPAIEIDGDPSRQDIDYDLARRAVTAGCLFALDSDAHSIAELRYAETAIAHARLAGVPTDRIVNCWPLKRLLEWARSRSG